LNHCCFCSKGKDIIYSGTIF